MEKLLIIPDVHGRTFWRKALTTGDYERIVFLGDYVDPYSREGIDTPTAIDILQEILQLKEQRKEQVVLLLGNHDLHYMYGDFYDLAAGSRYDHRHAPILKLLFREHRALFDMAYETTIKSRRYLFTHAGVNSLWLQRNIGVIGQADAPHLNLLTDTTEGIQALAQVGRMRGGYDESGSMVWADVDEMIHDSRQESPSAGDCPSGEPCCYQIFGHSQHANPLVGEHFACLDCRRAFALDDEGRLTDVTNGQ